MMNGKWIGFTSPFQTRIVRRRRNRSGCGKVDKSPICPTFPQPGSLQTPEGHQTDFTEKGLHNLPMKPLEDILNVFFIDDCFR